MSAAKGSVIIVAGGKGVRVGGEMPKQFLSIAGRPVLMHTISAFYDYDRDIDIVVVINRSLHEFWLNLCQEYSFTVAHRLVAGGETRFHSVLNGLDAVPDECEFVAVHDAARPCVTKRVITSCFDAAELSGCGVIPVVDESNSVRVISEDGGSNSFDRSLLKIVQTPQVFPVDIIKRAYCQGFSPLFTDDASVVESIGEPILLADGSELNIKITNPIDIKIAEIILRERVNTTL